MRYMVNHQEHFGRKFYQDLKTGYWISTDYPRIRAHRWVWSNHYGMIPPTYQIHHKDENKSNNSIENLELIDRSIHMKLHYKDERREMCRKRMNEVRHMTKKWHASPEGKAWHSYHAFKSGFGNWEPIEYKCLHCTKSYKSKQKVGSKFCSNNCKSQWRRQSGIDNEKRICVHCTKEFTCNKYSKVKCCSESCAAKQRWLDRK